MCAVKKKGARHEGQMWAQAGEGWDWGQEQDGDHNTGTCG